MTLLVGLWVLHESSPKVLRFGPLLLLPVLFFANGSEANRLLFQPAPVRELNSLPFPKGWTDELIHSTFVACDNPAKAIDALYRPILLLPQNPVQLQAIERDHGSIDNIIFSPTWKTGELAHWEGYFSWLGDNGFKMRQEEGWTLFSR